MKRGRGIIIENDEIKLFFNEFKEDLKDLKKQLKENVKEGFKEHNEIKEALRKLCDRMTNTENTIDNHLINSVKRAKTQREKILLIIAVGSFTGMIIKFFI